MRPIDADKLNHLSWESTVEAVLAVENAPTIEQPQWISCDVRLPQDNEPVGAECELVQVLLKDGSVTVGFCNRIMKMWFHIPQRGIDFENSLFDQTPVIAWQPLAQPPKDTP